MEARTGGATPSAPDAGAGGGPWRARLVVTGLGRFVRDPASPRRSCDPTSYLRVRKSRKFMGLQDDLAVVAAGRALESAGLAGRSLGERTGLYLTVGYIPFEREDIDSLLEGSLADGCFSMAEFASRAYRDAHPLITFRCLPNMPAYHVSTNFDLQGPYFVSYPGPGQTYQALDEARAALEAGTIDRALVCGVADQGNFLVAHHFGRLEPPVPPGSLLDAGGCLVVEPEALAAERSAPVRWRLAGCSIGYLPHRPGVDRHVPAGGVESGSGIAHAGAEALGPAALPVALDLEHGRSGRVRHFLRTRDGIDAWSTWEAT